MKLLSLYEPWSTLMALGVKKIETRSWATKYRGWLAIQSSQVGLNVDDLEHTCWIPEIREALEKEPDINSWLHCRPDLNGNRPNARRWQGRGAFPFGCIVAVVKLETCWPTNTLSHTFPELLTASERSFGDYTEGRYGWITSDLFRLPSPIPFKARQGLCDVDSGALETIRAQWLKPPNGG